MTHRSHIDSKKAFRDILNLRFDNHWRLTHFVASHFEVELQRIQYRMQKGLTSTALMEKWCYLLDMEVWWFLYHATSVEEATDDSKYPQNNWFKEVNRSVDDEVRSTVYWGQAFQIAQHRSGFSDAYCAKKLGIKKTSINQYKYRTQCSLKNLYKMSELFDLPLYWFAYVGLDKHRDKDTWDTFIFQTGNFAMYELDKGYFDD